MGDEHVSLVVREAGHGPLDGQSRSDEARPVDNLGDDGVLANQPAGEPLTPSEDEAGQIDGAIALSGNAEVKDSSQRRGPRIAQQVVGGQVSVNDRWCKVERQLAGHDRGEEVGEPRALVVPQQRCHHIVGLRTQLKPSFQRLGRRAWRKIIGQRRRVHVDKELCDVVNKPISGRATEPSQRRPGDRFTAEEPVNCEIFGAHDW